jgi:hypothetical protein
MKIELVSEMPKSLRPLKYQEAYDAVTKAKIGQPMKVSCGSHHEANSLRRALSIYSSRHGIRVTTSIPKSSSELFFNKVGQ